MDMNKRFWAWIFVAFFGLPLQAFAADSAVFSIAGSASKVDGTHSATLKPGDTVRPQGALITSDRSILRFRLPDESFFAMPSDSALRIDEFSYPKNAGNASGGRAFFSLLKGGFRTVTGMIGKLNRASYKVVTPVATLGIRGTEYGVYYCPPGRCEGVRSASSVFSHGTPIEVAAASNVPLLIQTQSSPPKGYLALRVYSGAISVDMVHGGTSSSFTLLEGKFALIEATFDANGNVIGTGAPLISDQPLQIFAANDIHVIVFNEENPIDVASSLEATAPPLRDDSGAPPSLPSLPRIEPDITIEPDPKASPS